MELVKKKCLPCNSGMPRLTSEQIIDMKKQVASWSLSEKHERIDRKFTFDTFPDAIKFVNRVAELAESEGHHPDIAVHYREVTLSLWTHKLGGLSENDFVLAAKIDQL